MTELRLYELTRVPERSYIKFLQLLGMELAPAGPAEADVVFTARAGAALGPVAERTQLSASPPARGPPLGFQTRVALGPVPGQLTDVRVFGGASVAHASTA